MTDQSDDVRLRAVLDIAIARLFDDAQLLEAAGFDAESEDSYTCAMLLKETRRKRLTQPRRSRQQ